MPRRRGPPSGDRLASTGSSAGCGAARGDAISRMAGSGLVAGEPIDLWIAPGTGPTGGSTLPRVPANAAGPAEAGKPTDEAAGVPWTGASALIRRPGTVPAEYVPPTDLLSRGASRGGRIPGTGEGAGGTTRVGSPIVPGRSTVWATGAAGPSPAVATSLTMGVSARPSNSDGTGGAVDAGKSGGGTAEIIAPTRTKGDR